MERVGAALSPGSRYLCLTAFSSPFPGVTLTEETQDLSFPLSTVTGKEGTIPDCSLPNPQPVWP